MSDAAVTVLVSGLVTITTMVIGFMTLWIKLRYGVETKIDNNTALTTAGTLAAADNAKVAVEAANLAANKVAATEDKITKMLNGQLEERIRHIVKDCFDPLNEMVRLHAEQDEKNMAEIRSALDEMRAKLS